MKILQLSDNVITSSDKKLDYGGLDLKTRV